MRDYTPKEARLILREMCDDLCFRMRLEGKKAGRVSVMAGYSQGIGGGFSRQCTLNIATDDNDSLIEAIYGLFDRFIEELPIRGLSICFSQLEPYKGIQPSLFETAEEAIERRALHEALDDLQIRYGRNSVLRATSLLEESTIRERHQQIGGHKA